MHVYKEPKLTFTCKHCGAVCDGDVHEFRDLNTMPPMWEVDCGWCHLGNTLTHPALVARFVGRMGDEDVFRAVQRVFPTLGDKNDLG